METSEIIESIKNLQSSLESAKAVYAAKSEAQSLASQEVRNALAEVSAIESQLAKAKQDLAQNLGVAPKTDVKPITPARPGKVVPAKQATTNNSIVYILIAAIVFWFAYSQGIIKVVNPFNPPPAPGPGPNPKPQPVTGPIHAAYIFDKATVSPSIGDIRGSTEEIQQAASEVGATYRAMDFNDDEAQKYYKEVIASVGKYPFLLIQDKTTGKLIGKPIVNPLTKDDVINAIKNARNGL